MPGSESADARLSYPHTSGDVGGFDEFDEFDDLDEFDELNERGGIGPRYQAIQERFLADVVPMSGASQRGRSPEVPAQQSVSQPAAGEHDEWGEPADAGNIVRPYSWTGGRTQPVQDLGVETLVSTAHLGHNAARGAAAEHHPIVVLCERPHSVAEVAALLSLPLGVARVLLADMVDTGWLRVHDNAFDPGGRPDLALLRRVRDGLYRL